MKTSCIRFSIAMLVAALFLGGCNGGTTSGSSSNSSPSPNPQPATDVTAPTVPVNVAASAVSTTQINLTWTASADNVGVAGYRIYRGGVQIATTTAPSYSNTGLSASTTYSYRVAAYDTAGNVSTQSAAGSATTPATAASSSPEAICPGGTNPNPNVLLCEDFDSDAPPTNPWPCKNSPTWHGWVPSNYGGPLSCNTVNASTPHSNARAYGISKLSGTNDTVDIEHTLPGNYPAVNIRFYMYIPAGSASEIMNTSSIHFLFVGPNNAAYSAIDFRRRSASYCGTACPSPNTRGENNSGYKWVDHTMLAIHTYTPSEDWVVETEGTPFFWEQHENEWHLVETRFDFANSRVSMWIDENQIVKDYPMVFPYSSVNILSFSGYGNITTTSYGINIDDFVVSTSYIGPRVN